MVVRQYASLAELAEMWGVSEPTVRRYVLAGEIPAIRIGRQIRIDVAEAEAVFAKPVVA